METRQQMMKGLSLLTRFSASRRTFSVSPSLKADILQSLYLSQLKAYKPSKAAAKTDLPETFALPAAPPVPAFDKTEAVTASSGKVEEEAWPALYDPIDDPNNYNGMPLCLEYSTRNYIKFLQRENLTTTHNNK